MRLHGSLGAAWMPFVVAFSSSGTGYVGLRGGNEYPTLIRKPGAQTGSGSVFLQDGMP